MIDRSTLYLRQAVCMACFAFSVMGATNTSFAQSDLYNRLQRAERDIQTLSKAVYKGEKLPDSMVGSIGDEQKYKARLDVRLNDLETQIRSLTGQVEQYQYTLDTLTTKINALEGRSTIQPQVISPSTNNGGPILTNPTLNIPNPGAAADVGVDMVSKLPVDQVILTPSGEPTKDYEAAFSLLKDGDNASAESAFKQFIERYPNDSLADNARYWLGEAYYVQNAYDKAARTFAEAYQKAPQGSKAPDNLLKLGLSLAGLGRKDDACVSFSQLDKEFGSTASAIVRRGEQEASSLGCSG